MKITDWILPKTSSPSTASPNTSTSSSTQQKENRHNNSSSKMPPKEKKSTGGGHSSSSPPKEKKPTASSSSAAESSTPRQSTSGSSGGTTTTTPRLHSTKIKQDVTLPQTKVKIIMKSSPEIDQVGNDVLFLISKATELFIDHITTQTYTQSHKVKNIEYRHLAEMAHKHPNLEFLRDIVPMKMTARDALKEVAKHRAHASRELLGD
ncbi:uncharacterized protein LOC110848125 [Folsomia candida]|uniref:uncharacterized protein LOC110848125 n=1 Tax=Folsomia candida TaxID=158441 RepID=UPI000B8F979C|nr:uncharacterized protein LOC110848125 [Folsomia candida]